MNALRNSFRVFAAMVTKDLKVFRSDRRAVVLSFALPIILASLFSMMNTGGGDGPASRIALGLVDLDQSKLSQEVVDALSKDANLDVQPITETEQARGRITAGKLGVAVLIPKGFGKNAARGMFRAGTRPELTFLTDPTHSAEAGMARGMLMQHAMKIVSREAFAGASGLELLEEQESQVAAGPEMPTPLRDALQSMFREIRKVRSEIQSAETGGDSGGTDFVGMDAPFTVVEEKIQPKGQINGQVMAAHSFAGMGVQFTLFAALEGGLALLNERKGGLWKRLRAAPVSRWLVLGARATSQSLIALALLVVLYAFGMVVFHVQIAGSFVGLLLVAAAYALMASGFGLFIAAIGNSPQAARGVSVLAVLIMVFLGGAWMPSFLFPGWVQTISLGVPTRWAVDGLEGATWRGLGLSALLPNVAVLLGFAVLFTGCAVARFRWDGE